MTARLSPTADTDGCLAIAIAGFGNADRVAEDKDHDSGLAAHLRRARIEALALSDGAAKPASEVTGISDPQTRAEATLRAASGESPQNRWRQ